MTHAYSVGKRRGRDERMEKITWSEAREVTGNEDEGRCGRRIKGVNRRDVR